MQKLIRDMHDHLIICGAGETGTYLVKELLKTGNVFVVIDQDEERLERISQLGEVPVLKGDAEDEGVLTTARVQKARGLASVLPEDKDNLLTTVTARLLNPNLRIVARCAEPGMAEKLLRHGANAAISPNMIGGLRIASELIRPSVVNFLDVMLRDQTGTIRVEEITVCEDSPWMGKKLREIDLRGRFDLLPLAVRKAMVPSNSIPTMTPSPAKGDILVVMGDIAATWKARDAAGNSVPHGAV